MESVFTAKRRRQKGVAKSETIHKISSWDFLYSEPSIFEKNQNNSKYNAAWSVHGPAQSGNYNRKT